MLALLRPFYEAQHFAHVRQVVHCNDLFLGAEAMPYDIAATECKGRCKESSNLNPAGG